MLPFQPWAAGTVRLSETPIGDRAIIQDWSMIGEVTGHAAGLMGGRVNEKSLGPEVTKKMVRKRLWELAQIEPERSRGSLKGQVDCCEQMYRLFKFEPALQRLNELASIDPSRTRGRRTSQDKAAKLLKRIVSSLKMDKSRVQ